MWRYNGRLSKNIKSHVDETTEKNGGGNIMKREDLEKLGLNNDQIEGVMKLKSSAINNNTDELNSLKQKVTELTTENQNLTNQINNANNEIQSYKDMDIDSIKKSAEDWKTKYEEMEANQKAEKEKSIREERTNAFFNDVKFASNAAKEGVIAEFNKKDFKYDEETQKFQGASEWLEDLKKNDTGAFASEVTNPKFTTNPTAPTKPSTNDELRKVMGLK